jgi:hypothetical protein
MAITNNLKKQIDQPVWEWTRFALTTFNSGAAGFATAIDGSDRYIYYQYPSIFQRYDTWSDTWASLNAPTYFQSVTIAGMAYSKSQGNRGKVLSGGSSTITIPGLAAPSKLIGQKIRITSGPGAEQTRTISAASDVVVLDSGFQTSGSATSLTDPTKRWQINQWVGYTCRIIFGVNNIATQRTVVYNDNTTLYFYDVQLAQYDPWDNQSFPAAFSASTYNTYELCTQTVTVSSPFTTAPTADSRFMIQSGVIWLMSSGGSAPFFTFQMYDVLTDVWYQKTTPQNIFAGALGTEVAITPLDEVEAAYISKTATTGTARTLTDSTLTLTTDQYRNYQIRTTGGTGAGQRRRIVSNRATTFEVDTKWDTAPDVTTTYEIWPDTDLIHFVGSGQAMHLAYDVEADQWATGPHFDYGMVNSATITKTAEVPLGISTAVDNGTGSVTTVTVAAAGSGYVVGDIIQITGGSNARLYVTGCTTAGGVTSVSFNSSGSGYTVSLANATTAISGTGTGCTINIATIGRTGLITTTINHFLKVGDTVTIAGSAVAGWNGTYTVLSAISNTQLTVASTATASMTFTSTVSTSLVVDPTKNWDVNEHTGKFLFVLQGSSLTTTGQIRRITSNTATTITIPAYTGTAVTSGQSRYIIIDPASYGRDNKFWANDQLAYGYPTSGTTTSITDTTKNWIRGTWVAHVVRITAGTGLGSELTVTANNNNTLTFSAAAFTPDTTTRYEIMDTFGTATSGALNTLNDTTKNWITNQWSTKRIRILGGTAAASEAGSSSNTATQVTAAVGTVDNTSNYVIYGTPFKNAGTTLRWTWGNGNHKYMFSAIGGASVGVMRFDITTGIYEYFYPNSGQGETFTTGTMWAYDGGDRVYVQKDQTGRIFYFDVVKREFVNSGTVPYGMSTAVTGNRMDIIKTEDGLKYLYVARHAGTEMWRTLIFW